MIVSPWSQLSENERLSLASKLVGLRLEITETDQVFEAAAERFDQYVIEYDQRGRFNPLATQDNLLTAQNFILHAGGHENSSLWRQITEIKGFRRSYLELKVSDRDEFLHVLTKCGYVINLEPFWTIHKFDSARERTEYSHHPPLHFANDRANEAQYGPNYFFVHWDGASPWFRKSKWPIRHVPGARQLEQIYAAMRHRRGSPCPRIVNEHLRRR